MRKLISILAVTFCFASAHIYAQQINPNSQINWSQSTGCSTTGAPYIPASNTCVPMITGLVQLAPTGAQSIVQPSVSQPLAVNFFQAALSNGTVMADQFCSGSIGSSTFGGVTLPACSADACTKLLAANKYAVSNAFNFVDATHFSGVQACSVNPYASLNSTANSSANLTDTFGSVHFQSTVQWVIQNSGVVLRGMGPYSTQVEYTGSTAIGSVLLVNGNNGTVAPYQANGINNVEVDGMFFYGDAANLTDTIDLNFVNRSKFTDVYTWGSTACGIRTNAAVTDTFTRPHTSAQDATYIGVTGAGHTVPQSGLCFSSGSGNSAGIQTTNGTVTDAVAEDLTGTGWQFLSANSMTFTSGTSEFNVNGLVISAGSKYNTFVSLDLEGNTANTTGVDITDNSGYNMFLEPIASSPCTGSCTASVNLTGAAGQDWFIGPAQALYQVTGSGLYGFVPTGPNAGATIPTTASGFLSFYQQGHEVFIPYFSTLP
jgi:hypothetical protein